MTSLEKTLENIQNSIIDNILTEEEIKGIYDIIDNANPEQVSVQERVGHAAYLLPLKEDLRSKLEKLVQGIYGEDWSLEAYQFARYSLEYGYVPKLYPHFDDAFSTQRLTLDIQVSGTSPWPLVVEGRTRILENNQGLIFSGTAQIHWREPFDFQESDKFDMIFCHFHNTKDTSKISQDWKDYMSKKELFWTEKVEISKDAKKI